MSKKNKKTSIESPSNSGMNHAAEYRIIKHDLVRVVMLNLIYLAGLLAVYFSNQKTHYLEHWISKIVRF